MAADETTPSDGAAGSSDGRFRLLVVASQSEIGGALRQEIDRRASGRAVEVRVVAPALASSGFAHAMGDVDDAIDDAKASLERSADQAEDAGYEVETRVGDSDPILAIQDALADFRADEILLVTRPSDEALWLEDDLFERAKTKFEPPIAHFVVADDEASETERSGRGLEQPSDEANAEVETRSKNFPPLSPRDTAGIVFAIVGTIVLVLLAANCGGEGTDFGSGGAADNGCTIRAILAGAMALLNIAHVVGLVLFESVRYRGGFARFFSIASIGGTTLAVIVSLLIV